MESNRDFQFLNGFSLGMEVYGMKYNIKFFQFLNGFSRMQHYDAHPHP